MKRTYIAEVTTDDSKKTYRWVNHKPESDIPQLWQLRVFISPLGSNGEIDYSAAPSYSSSPATVFIVERSTLESTEWLEAKQKTPETPKETLEDRIIQLLKEIGVKFNQ